MQHDAVHTYHWMTPAQFLAATVAFTPSFAFVIAGGPHFDAIRAGNRIQALLTGAGAAAIGAIAGSAVPLALSLTRPWQAAVLGAAALWLLALRRGVVTAILTAAAIGPIIALTGTPIT